MTDLMACAHIDAIGVAVSNLARSIAFYRAVGVHGLPDDPGDAPHVEGELADGVRLMLDSEELLRGIDPGWDPRGSGRVALAVRCSSPAAVDELYGRLDADGFGHRPPWDAFWGQRYATVHDPDGTAVDLYAPLDDGGAP